MYTTNLIIASNLLSIYVCVCLSFSYFSGYIIYMCVREGAAPNHQ